MPTRRMARTLRDGFTMIELMVAMIIVGIIAGTVIPKVGQTMAKSKVQQAASIMAGDIQRAFSMASKRRSPVRISVDTANRTFYIRNRARDTTYLSRYYKSSNEMNLSRLQTSDTTIIVYPNGLSSKAITINVYASTQRRQIAATRAGQIRITSP
jgi:prepilin-type N-terminal cleavage/methylation domain-containing protein